MKVTVVDLHTYSIEAQSAAEYSVLYHALLQSWHLLKLQINTLENKTSPAAIEILNKQADFYQELLNKMDPFVEKYYLEF